jgi:predicted transposase YdaD
MKLLKCHSEMQKSTLAMPNEEYRKIPSRATRATHVLLRQGNTPFHNVVVLVLLKMSQREPETNPSGFFS